MNCTVTILARAGIASAAVLGAMLAAPAVAQADSCVDSVTGAPLPLAASPCADVLAQEARWLTAITAGDVAVVETVLGPTFRHVTAEGESLDRAQEIAAMAPLDVTFEASDQNVDIVGDTAVIHGVNTVRQHGEVVARERFIDVFYLDGGVWKALAAQEVSAAN